jgi:hypothetical protein
MNDEWSIHDIYINSKKTLEASQNGEVAQRLIVV